jgi:hypothetical protein
MMAWDIFNEFKKNGIFAPETSKRFEEEILSKGGTVHPRELFINFLGREPSMDAFLMSFDKLQFESWQQLIAESTNTGVDLVWKNLNAWDG